MLDESLQNKISRIADGLRRSREANSSQYARLNVIWQEVLDVLRYVLTLAPADVLRARMHSGLFVGEAPWQYWHSADAYDAEDFARRLGYIGLTKDIPEERWIGEARNASIPRPMGVSYKGRVLNGNVVRFQSIVTNLVLTGIWDRTFGNGSDDAAVVVEVGPGYGGIAEFLFARSDRNIHFLAVDLPEILLLCCGYVLAARPETDVYVISEPGELATIPKDRHALLLLPTFSKTLLGELDVIDLAINAASFQEMTTDDIRSYLDLIVPRLKGVLYSDNIDRHLLNTQSQPISEIMKDYGHIFPKPGVYDNVVSEHKWDWFYATYLLGSADAVEALEKQIRVYFGPGKTGAVMDYKNDQFTMVV